MKFSCHKILIGFLLLQVCVDATVIVFTLQEFVKGALYNMIDSFPNREATKLAGLGIQGQLELAAPQDACSPIAHPFFVPTGIRRNLVLINGTDRCDFYTKVRNARKAGFEAAILYDPFSQPFNYGNITFPIERSEINMTVALVSSEDGIKLQKYLFPESRKHGWIVEIISTEYSLFVKILLFVFVVLPLGCLALLFALGLVLLFILGIYEVYKHCRNMVQERINEANMFVQNPIPSESEYKPLLAPESWQPNICPRATEGLRDELVGALGSVNNGQEKETKKDNTQTVIV